MPGIVRHFLSTHFPLELTVSTPGSTGRPGPARDIAFSPVPTKLATEAPAPASCARSSRMPCRHSARRQTRGAERENRRHGTVRGKRPPWKVTASPLAMRQSALSCLLAHDTDTHAEPDRIHAVIRFFASFLRAPVPCSRLMLSLARPEPVHSACAIFRYALFGRFHWRLLRFEVRLSPSAVDRAGAGAARSVPGAATVHVFAAFGTFPCSPCAFAISPPIGGQCCSLNMFLDRLVGPARLVDGRRR